jgi:predicted transcriptional regulator
MGEAWVEHQFRSLTAQIVSAHVANNNVAVDQLAGLIREVYQMLATVEQVPVAKKKKVGRPKKG